MLIDLKMEVLVWLLVHQVITQMLRGNARVVTVNVPLVLVRLFVRLALELIYCFRTFVMLLVLLDIIVMVRLV